MNQKGEATLLSVMILFAMSSLIVLSSLELRRSFRLLQNRTQLFLCAKETKGEIKNHLRFMGRTNWVIKNTAKAALIAVFIPGLQGAALEAEKVKKILIAAQNLELISYLKKMADLKGKGCPLDPRLLITPFELGTLGFARDENDGAILRDQHWSYLFFFKPFTLKMEFSEADLEGLRPKVHIETSEKGAMLSSLWSLH
jgi:hypothetical protein